MLNLYYHPIYTDGLDPTVRFPRERYQLLARRLKENPSIHIQCSPIATREQIVAAHNERYVDLFIEGKLDATAIRRIGLRPWTPTIVERTYVSSAEAYPHSITPYLISLSLVIWLVALTTPIEIVVQAIVSLTMSLSALRSPQRTRDQKVLILDLDVPRRWPQPSSKNIPTFSPVPNTPKVTSPSVNNKAISMSTSRTRPRMPTT